MAIRLHYGALRFASTPRQNLARICREEPIPLLRDNPDDIGKPDIKIVATKDGALAHVYGRIDIDSSPAIRDRLLAFLQAPCPKTLSIDLSAVTHIDSSGVATLIEALKIAHGCKSEVRLQGLHDRLLRLFEVTGILSLFNGNV